MKNYRNNRFYNIVLPILLVVAIFATLILGVAVNSLWLIIVSMALMVSFKFIHQWLERLSLQQREDYGLINKKGEYYPGSLSDCDERRLLEIREKIND